MDMDPEGNPVSVVRLQALEVLPSRRNLKRLAMRSLG